jgi:hypothetical protein
LFTFDFGSVSLYLGTSYLGKNELHCFSNFLHREPSVAKILPPIF